MLLKLDFESILSEVSYKDWQFFVGEDGDRLYLQLKFNCRCSSTGELRDWSSRKWPLSRFMGRDEVVKTAYKAVETAEIHELREFFKYRGKAIFGPHIDVDALWEVADRLEVRPT